MTTEFTVVWYDRPNLTVGSTVSSIFNGRVNKTYEDGSVCSERRHIKIRTPRGYHPKIRTPRGVSPKRENINYKKNIRVCVTSSLLSQLFNSHTFSTHNQICCVRHSKKILSNSCLLPSQSFLLTCSHLCLGQKLSPNPAWASFTAISLIKHQQLSG